MHDLLGWKKSTTNPWTAEFGGHSISWSIKAIGFNALAKLKYAE